MPIDSNIILQGRGPQFDNPLDVANKAMSLKALSRQSDLQEQEYAKKSAVNAALKANTSVGPDGKPAVNRQGALSQMFKDNPQAAMEQEKVFQQYDLDQLKYITEASKDLAWKANEQNWPEIKAKAVSMGLPNADKFPDQYMPQMVEGWRMGTLKGEERLAQQWKEREFELNQDKFAFEKQKAATEKVTKSKDVKQNQALAAGFGRRLQQSEDAFKKIAETGYDRSSVASGIAAKLAPNLIRQDVAVQQDQAERNFLTAVLRRESGAAISDGEFTSGEQQYFPRAGDGPDTLKQKALNRAQVLESMRGEAGNAWDQIKLIEEPKTESPAAPKTFKTNEIEWAT